VDQRRSRRNKRRTARTKGEEAKVEGADDVGAADVVEAVPEDARDIVAGRQGESIQALLLASDGVVDVEGGRVEGARCGGEEELERVDAGSEDEIGWQSRGILHARFEERVGVGLASGLRRCPVAIAGVMR
jgi:hypothetical protein